jgi:H+/Cl- antiporter ClcA
MRNIEPDFWRNLRDELVLGRQWIDRAVVLGYAVITGLVVVAFTLLSELASHAHDSMRSSSVWASYGMLVWTPLLTVAVLWWGRRYAPAALGGGIPRVIRALDDGLPEVQRHWLVSLRVSMHQIGLVSTGLLAGLSMGREGPTVQVGAGVMVHARRWLSKDSGIDAHDLMVAGAAAGIAAAFNTPLGGIMFALEKLSRRRAMSTSALMIVSILIAGLVAVSVFGTLTYFGRLSVQTLNWSLLGPGLLVAVVAGLAGGLFSRLMVASVRGMPDVFSAWRRNFPLRFAAGCALGVAVIGLVTNGATAGAGDVPTRALLDGQADLPVVYTLLKFIATWLTAWTGVPAGVFAPSMAIGAGIGHDIALLTGVSRELAIPLIALGMVGFLAATTQGPMTAFIIVMEMVAGQSMVLSLMACALLSSGVARLVCKPMYTELAGLLWLPPLPDPPAPAAPAEGAAAPGPGPQRPPTMAGQGAGD